MDYVDISFIIMLLYYKSGVSSVSVPGSNGPVGPLYIVM